jgi:pyridoxal 5'-phosphate synthase glutaminase subunit Pdx2
MGHVISSFEDLKALEGLEVGVSDWLLISQEHINQFANLTHDHQWIHVDVERNAYGRQTESFEADIDIPLFPESPFRGVFIRAPIVTSTAEDVETLARFEGNPVLVRQGLILAASFHPELTDDTRVHDYFLSFL